MMKLQTDIVIYRGVIIIFVLFVFFVVKIWVFFVVKGFLDIFG